MKQLTELQELNLSWLALEMQLRILIPASLQELRRATLQPPDNFLIYCGFPGLADSG